MRLIGFLLAAPLALAACNAKPEAQTGNSGDASSAPSAPAERLTLGSDGLPRFREGLWEVTELSDGEREVSKHCAGAEVRDDVRAMFANEPAGCTVERSSSPLGVKARWLCDQAGVKSETSLTMWGSATSWNMTLAIHAIGADGARDGGETTMKARWIGACPAGVKPGEEVGG